MVKGEGSVVMGGSLGHRQGSEESVHFSCEKCCSFRKQIITAVGKYLVAVVDRFS